MTKLAESNFQTHSNFAATESEIQNWLSAQGLAGADIPILLEGFCERLNLLGVMIARGHLSTATLDPQHQGFSLTWRPDLGIAHAESFPHRNEQVQRWLQSPLYYMLNNQLSELRCRLTSTDELDFPVLEEFRTNGLTDYYAAVFGFGWSMDSGVTDGYKELGMICSWATAAKDGFGPELECLKRLLPTFALAVKSAMSWRITHKVFSAYLGPDAAARVLRGEVRRGSSQCIQAAILIADLRGFTRLADTIPSSELVAMLNGYLECIVPPIEARGGQVLKFMGDGLLATFDLANSDAAIRCEGALGAAAEALAAVGALNAQRQTTAEPAMELDIVLHLGEVLYGNVGSITRLDFTVIGPAVNEAARMETLCGILKVNLLLSHAFRDRIVDCACNIVALGEHQLRGVREAKALYTIH